jgi:carboxyl-terminal processing protease
MPDVFVPVDTTGRSYYYTELIYMGMFREFAFQYADKNRQKFEQFDSYLAFSDYYDNSSEIINEFVQFAEEKGIKKREKEFNYSLSNINLRLKAQIISHIWKNDGFYPVINQKDVTVTKALESF